MNDIKNVCVYSASSTKIAKVYFDVAEELGRLLAEKKINLINGAGCIGLMAATSDATLEAGGTVTGDRKSTRLNSSHIEESRMPSSA